VPPQAFRPLSHPRKSAWRVLRGIRAIIFAHWHVRIPSKRKLTMPIGIGCGVVSPVLARNPKPRNVFIMNVLIVPIFLIAPLIPSVYGLLKSNSIHQRIHWVKNILLHLAVFILCYLNWPTMLGPQFIGDTIFAYASLAITIEAIVNFKRYTVRF
jgi:hypothetical protein